MATKKFSAFTAGSTNQVPTDVLVGLDLSLAAASQNTKWTLNNLFSVVTRNITDGALRFGGFAAPAVSGAGEGSIYFDSTSNTFKISENAAAYVNIGNVRTSGFTTTRVPIASGANTLTDDAGLSYSTVSKVLSVGTAAGGGVALYGSTGFYNLIASAGPAANRTSYWPDSAPTAGQFLYVAGAGATTVLGWQTAPSGSGTANQIAVWGASNALSGSSALTFASGLVSISGTTNPGIAITGTAATESGITVTQSVSGAAADAFHLLSTPSTSAFFQLTTAGFTPANLIKANQLRILGATGTVETLFELADASRRFVFGVNNVEAASINATSTLGLVLGVASSLTGRVRMYNSAGATYTQLSAGNAAASLNYILPATSPTLNQVLTASAPSGSDVTLSWSTPSSSAALTATQVGFGDGSNLLSGSADFTYTTAVGQLSISKSVNGSMFTAVTNGSNGASAQARFGATADVVGAGLAAYSSGFTTAGLITANSVLLDMDAPTAIIAGRTAGALIFGMGTTTERARLTDTTFLLSVDPSTGSGLNVASATVSSGNLVRIAMTGTAAASNTKTALAITSSGANGTASQTVFGQTVSVTNTGTTNTNIALQLTASGATTANTALNVTAGAIVQASNLAAAFVSGPNGATNPTFLLNNSTASAATGVSITSAAAGSGVTVAAISSGTGESIILSAKGTGAGRLTVAGDTGASDGVIYVTRNDVPAASFFSAGNRGGTTGAAVSSTAFLGFTSNSSSALLSLVDTFMRRAAAANIALGATDASAPVAQTLSVQSVVAGTSNTAGVDWTFKASAGTGTGAGGNFLFQTAAAGSSGTSQNTFSTKLTLTSDGRLFGSALHNNTGAVTGTTNQYIASGTYTPTLTDVANCTTNSVTVSQWIRVGNVVTVTAYFNIDPTSATTLTKVGISLPIASNLAGANQCCGTACAPNLAGYVGAILGDTTNDRAELWFTTAVDVSDQLWIMTFTYLIS